MNINGITALDYERQGNSLALILSGATFEEVSTMDTALLEVRTDDGDLVEAFAGYALRSITYDTAAQTYRAVLALATDDNTAKTLDSMAAKIVELQSASYDVMDALTELAGIVAGGGENNG